jgi:thioredoxin reductase
MPARRSPGRSGPHTTLPSASLHVRLETEIADGGGEGSLDHLVLRDSSAQEEETVTADALFVTIGAQRRTAGCHQQYVETPKASC